MRLGFWVWGLRVYGFGGSVRRVVQCSFSVPDFNDLYVQILAYRYTQPFFEQLNI